MKNNLYIVGIDGSEWSARATQKAVSLAKDTGASVKLVYVINFQPIIVGAAYYIPELNTVEQEEKVQASDIDPLIAKYSHEVELSTEIIWGDPVELLLDQAKKTSASMFFMGRRGRSRLSDLLMGSTANKVAHCAGIPIVLVP
jgi:nucleotide-binding universal stress UspA family protein